MYIRTLLVGAVALVAGVSESQASEWSRIVANHGCTHGALSTCASVEVKFSRFETEPMINVGLRNYALAAPSVSLLGGARFEHLLANAGVSSSFQGPLIIHSWNGDDGRNWECRPGGRDCRVVEDPATTVPEPLTMTLLASGLVGMGGVSGIRRRLKAKALQNLA